MTDLVEWLEEQLRTDEQIACAATPGPWQRTHPEWPRNTSISNGDGRRVVASAVDWPSTADADHIVANDPAAVLRTIAAHRAILAAYVDCVERRDHWEREGRPDYVKWSKLQVHAFDYTLRLLAAIYESRPGYLEEWKL